jgi:hypothetical protein
MQERLSRNNFAYSIRERGWITEGVLVVANHEDRRLFDRDSQFLERARSRYDLYVFKGFHRKQVIITGYGCVRFSANSCGQILWIAQFSRERKPCFGNPIHILSQLSASIVGVRARKL